MLENIDIAVIGAGAMGGAIIAGLLRQDGITPAQIVAADSRQERRDELHRQYAIEVSQDNLDVARRGQVVILAVKPQVIPIVLPPLRGALHDEAVCLSIVAGVPMQTFAQTLQHAAIVRSIPNTPAQVGEGMTVWTAASVVSEQQRTWVREILGALGRVCYVDSETYLDMATAISGSGPAYVFLILEAMSDAGVRLGLSRSVAEELAAQTMLGAVRYAQHSGMHPALLRNAVTSPGGTTAAGLSALENGRLRAVIDAAVQAAYERSRTLGKTDDE